MSNIISNFWYGNIRPAEKSGLDNPEIKEIEKVLSENYHRLVKTFNEEQKLLFEKYIENTNENLCLVEEQAFCDGFCLGVKFFSEAFEGGNKFSP